MTTSLNLSTYSFAKSEKAQSPSDMTFQEKMSYIESCLDFPELDFRAAISKFVKEKRDWKQYNMTFKSISVILGIISYFTDSSKNNLGTILGAGTIASGGYITGQIGGMLGLLAMAELTGALLNREMDKFINRTLEIVETKKPDLYLKKLKKDDILFQDHLTRFLANNFNDETYGSEIQKGLSQIQRHRELYSKINTVANYAARFISSAAAAYFSYQPVMGYFGASPKP